MFLGFTFFHLPNGSNNSTHFARYGIIVGETDAEVVALVLWPPDEKNQLIGKDLDAGKD